MNRGSVCILSCNPRPCAGCTVLVAVDPAQPVRAPPVCAGPLQAPRQASARPNAKVQGHESEATRHTRTRPDRDAAAVRQFPYWPYRTFSWTWWLAGLVGIHHDPPGPLGSSRSGTERRRLTRRTLLPDRGRHGRYKLLPAPSRKPNAILKRQHGRCGIFTISSVALLSQPM